MGEICGRTGQNNGLTLGRNLWFWLHYNLDYKKENVLFSHAFALYIHVSNVLNLYHISGVQGSQLFSLSSVLM